MMTALLTIAAAAAVFQSGPRHVALVELYTSEGCSSCPPAERWMSELRSSPELWRSVVPVSFHVNYWDRLGWKDALSSRAFTQREYAYAAAWHARSVYTPCFVRDGEEWQPELEGAEPARSGVLRVEVLARAPLRCRVSYDGTGGTDTGRRLVAHVALLANGLRRHIGAGENAGAMLTHDFAVVALAEGPLAQPELTLGSPLVPEAPRWALAAWVTASGSQVPLQATGGELP